MHSAVRTWTFKEKGIIALEISSVFCAPPHGAGKGLEQGSLLENVVCGVTSGDV